MYNHPRAPSLGGPSARTVRYVIDATTGTASIVHTLNVDDSERLLRAGQRVGFADRQILDLLPRVPFAVLTGGNGDAIEDALCQAAGMFHPRKLPLSITRPEGVWTWTRDERFAFEASVWEPYAAGCGSWKIAAWILTDPAGVVQVVADEDRARLFVRDGFAVAAGDAAVDLALAVRPRLAAAAADSLCCPALGLRRGDTHPCGEVCLATAEQIFYFAGQELRSVRTASPQMLPHTVLLALPGEDKVVALNDAPELPPTGWAALFGAFWASPRGRDVSVVMPLRSADKIPGARERSRPFGPTSQVLVAPPQP